MTELSSKPYMRWIEAERRASEAEICLRALSLSDSGSGPTPCECQAIVKLRAEASLHFQMMITDMDRRALEARHQH